MLKKMLIQGLVGAAAIAAAAVVYAQVQAPDKTQDNGYLTAPVQAGGDRDPDRHGKYARKGEHGERRSVERDRDQDHD